MGENTFPVAPSFPSCVSFRVLRFLTFRWGLSNFISSPHPHGGQRSRSHCPQSYLTSCTRWQMKHELGSGLNSTPHPVDNSMSEFPEKSGLSDSHQTAIPPCPLFASDDWSRNPSFTNMHRPCKFYPGTGTDHLSQNEV